MRLTLRACCIAITALAITVGVPDSVPPAQFGADALVGPGTGQGAAVAATPAHTSASAAFAGYPAVRLGTTARRCAYVVGYKVNLSVLVTGTGAPDTASRNTMLAVINAAVADLSSRTGQAYRYDGATTYAPTLADFSTGPDDLTIVIKGPAGNDFYMATAPGTSLAGMTRWLLDGGGTSVVEISPVMIDLRTATSRSDLYAAVQHELGHSVGLQHSPNVADIMYRQLNTATPTVYTKADTAALAASRCRS
jgi:hypothetical protein